MHALHTQKKKSYNESDMLIWIMKLMQQTNDLYQKIKENKQKKCLAFYPESFI